MKNIFLVDADDTLLDFHGSSAKAIQASFAKFNLPWKEEYLPVFEKINGEFWARLERRELTRDELMERRFPFYLQALGFTEVDGKAFNQSFLTHLATHPVYNEGAEDFLRALQSIGRIYIVTNGTEWIQKSRFDIAKLWQYAKGVFVSQQIGFDKPAKEFTDYALSHIPQFALEKAVWLGDSLNADIKSANEANMTSIWYNPRQKEAIDGIFPDYTAKNFQEILKILRKI